MKNAKSSTDSQIALHKEEYILPTEFVLSLDDSS